MKAVKLSDLPLVQDTISITVAIKTERFLRSCYAFGEHRWGWADFPWAPLHGHASRRIRKEPTVPCPALWGKSGEEKELVDVNHPSKSVPMQGTVYNLIQSNNSRKHRVCEQVLNAFSLSLPCLVFIAFTIQLPKKKKNAFILARKEKRILLITFCSQKKMNYISIVR